VEWQAQTPTKNRDRRIAEFLELRRDNSRRFDFEQ
jgi:hypothetical protein